MEEEEHFEDRVRGGTVVPGPRDIPLLYVGIGASAGGLEAIESFFAAMPPDSGMAFVVVQHLSPDYKSLMVELLSKRTEMPVQKAEDGMAVMPNSVYLIPPKKNLTIFHGKLLLSDQDHSKGLNLPIDVFFQSLAQDQGEKAVGIVLSGTGSDGMRGIRAIKEYGGMVIVQTEESAKFDGMPRSAISTGLADYVLPPETMSRTLLDLVRGPYVVRTERPDPLLSDETGLDRIFSLLREKCKLDFTQYKPSTIIRRLERRMTVNRISDLREYARFIETYPRELTTLFRELLIGVTSFFRDPKAFELLAEKWVPEMLERSDKWELRFWVAGCSTGEEAYSLAMLASELNDRAARPVLVKIFATDVDGEAITRASAGVYPASIAADLPQGYLAKYFHTSGHEVQVSRKLREMVVFARHNLIKDPPFTNIDLTSCRNLLIYLQPMVQQKVLQLLNFSLNPGGILFLGSSETVGEQADYFELLHHKWKMYRAKGKRLLAGISPEITAPYVKSGRHANAVNGLSPRLSRLHGEERTIERVLQGLVGDYIPTLVVVNENLELLHTLGDASRYFRVPSGRVQNDITKMAVKDLAIPLATGIQRAISLKEDVRYTNVRIVEAGGKAMTLQIHIKILPEKKGQEPLVAVLLDEVREREDPEDAGDAVTFNVGKEVEQHILNLEQELQFTKENLQATVEELETSNEELQATNEELLAGNEELQSTNEELQSVNEELHTVNSEHQIKIMELTEITNDFDNLMASTNIAILFLDEDLNIRRFTPSVAEIFNIMSSDIGRPLNDLSHRLQDIKPVDAAKAVQQSLVHYEKEVCADGGRWFLMRILPYNLGPEAFSGVTLSFTDISHLRLARELLAESTSKLKEMARLAGVGHWEYRLSNDRFTCSEEVHEIFELVIGDTLTPEVLFARCIPESRVVLERLFREACGKGAPFDEVLQIVTNSGNRKWIRAIAKASLEDGVVSVLTGVLLDITRVTEAERELHRSERRYRELFDNMTSGVLVLEQAVVESPGQGPSAPGASGEGVDFIIADINSAAEGISRLRASEVIGQSLVEAIPSVRENNLLSVLQRVDSTGGYMRFPVFRYRNADGGDQWVEHSIYKLPSGEIVVVYDDITERMHREREKDHEEHRGE